MFRVPAAWHALRPVHKLRRYLTGRYLVRLQRPINDHRLKLIDAALDGGGRCAAEKLFGATARVVLAGGCAYHWWHGDLGRSESVRLRDTFDAGFGAFPKQSNP